MSTNAPSWWSYKKPVVGAREPGPHGVTLWMIKFSREHPQRWVLTRKTPRDRSLHGKARRLARKAVQRRPLTSASDW